MKSEVKGTGCCPPFDPEPWQDKTLLWENKRFLKENVKTIMFMPLNFGGKMKRIMADIETAGAECTDSMVLSDHTSKWNMDLLIAVDKDIPGKTVKTITGTFYSRVYEGKFNETGKWCRDYEKKADDLGFKVIKWYMWYTTCPKCAKVYGKNHVVIICEVTSK